ncbi:hypothetical protein KKE60_08675, partial [Patescibacteria group bacterium]|nr:hypothetical protein [Patescibacteria group bacterium]
MVSLADNAISIEVGVRISYQWAVDARDSLCAAMTRAVRSYYSAVESAESAIAQAHSKLLQFGREAAHRVSMAEARAICRMEDTHRAVRQSIIHTATACHAGVRRQAEEGRDKLASALLGIPADRLGVLRQLAVNPQLLVVQATAVPASVTRTRKPKAQAELPIGVLSAVSDGIGVEASVLRAGVEAVRGIAKHASIPIINNDKPRQQMGNPIYGINNLCIAPVEGGITLTANRLDIGAEVTIPAAIGVDFTATIVPAIGLKDALKGAKGQVGIRHIGGKHPTVEVRTSGGSVSLYPLPAEEFRPIAATDGLEWHPARGFLRAVDRVTAAISP